MTSNDCSLLAASSRVALAAYLHDLGKFAERARLDVADDMLQAHITQYCPYRSDANGRNGFHTHKHAAYTAIAFDCIEHTAPDLIRGDMTPFVNREALQNNPALSTDSLINAAAAHHKPQTFLQWIIATADRLASGFERTEFDSYNLAADENKETATGRNHYQARQLSLFEQIRLKDSMPIAKSTKDLEWRYPLLALSPQSIFPQKRADCEPGQDGSAQEEYRQLWQEFLQGLQDIPASHRSQWQLWLDHFDTAWLTFTHAIPAATAFGVKPEVSLYDHSKSTAALATALWRWHDEHEQTDQTAADRLRERSDWDEKKLLLIQGDFFGIQEFIFAEGSETNRAAARLLRGRSFQVSLFTEIAALKLLDALALPSTSQIINAAGKFLIVAPNTESARRTVQQVQQDINNWFLQHSFGMAGLGLVAKPTSPNDLLKGRFSQLMTELFAALETAKLQRFNLTADTDPVLQIKYPLGPCQYNGRLPADEKNADKGSAALSRDQITLGTALTRKDRLLVVRGAQALSGQNITVLETPIFGYQVGFTASETVTGKFGALAQNGALARCWDFSLPSNLQDTLWQGYARRYINAYVPEFTSLDERTRDKYLVLGAMEDTEVCAGNGKPLDHIACEDRFTKSDGGWQGQVALMSMKGDVDNMGQIFQSGLQQPTFAKMAALSRQMNAFFSIWLPALCQNEFPNTYTVFAGGDDFFLIGPWLGTQRLAQRMAESFKTYVAHNPGITFSAGLVMTKPGLPVHTLASQAEQALETAKGAEKTNQQERKNAVVVFGERVRWPDWSKVQSAQSQLDLACDTYQLSTGYVYGLLRLVDLATDQSKPEHAMWRSRFAYRTRRYVVDKLPVEQRQRAQTELGVMIGQQGIQELGSRYRIPLFNHFYRQR